MHNEIKGCRTQRLKDFLNQNNKESSEESKMEPTMTEKGQLQMRKIQRLRN